MKILCGLLSLLVLFAAAAHAQVATEKPPIILTPEQQVRFDALLPNLRCLVCQNESLADSQAPLALDLRYQIRGMLAKGDSDFQVKKYLTDRYGEFILYGPRVELRTYFLWFGPLFLLVIGLVAVFRFTRRRQVTPALPAVDQTALRKLLDDEAR